MLKDLERALMRALVGEGPIGAAGRVDPDGFALTRLLVSKLRFERICRGDDLAREWFDREPERFTGAFKAYAREVPPIEYFPRQEAACFRAWCRDHGFSAPWGAERVL